MTVPHIPALRRGRAYESLDKTAVLDYRNGSTLATVSQVNAGIVRKDLAGIAESRAALKKLSVAELIEICAGRKLFLDGTLPLGDHGPGQSAAQYIETLSATSGLPHVMVRRNMAKIHGALTQMKTILNGLTRGLDPAILDTGFAGRMSFSPVGQSLGLVMPSNSPAVNSLWLPAIPLKIPVIIKPGREEPWTPYRLIQAFITAGCPAEAFGFYPTGHEGAGEILRSCGRSLLFGDKTTTGPYANNPAIQIHGPGYSKILAGDDEIERWPEFIDLMIASISDNGGRSCINASAIIVPKYAEEIADALAQKLGPIVPLPATDENAAAGRVCQSRKWPCSSIPALKRACKPAEPAMSPPRIARGRAAFNLKAALICGPPSYGANRSRILWPIASFCAPTPASSRCRKGRCCGRSGLRWL